MNIEDKLVRVEWVDSSTSSPWILLEDFKDEQCDPIKIVSYGIIVKETDDYLVIAQNYGSNPSQISNTTAIPKGCIIQQNIIKKEGKMEEKKTLEELPKFHQGEWIVWQGKCYKVNYNGCGYELVDQNGLSTSLEYGTIDESAHLWDITKDANGGDVLVNGSNIFIFSHFSGTRAMGCCHINLDNGRFYDDKGKNECFGLIDADFSPATKKQRDLLFVKMREEGFEWDAEKKELRKIEQKLANSAKNCKNDTLLDLLNKIPSCITVDGIDYHFVLKKTIFYKAFYEGEGEGSGKVIFWVTAYSPIDLLAEMLEILKEKGLLE